MCTCKRSSCVGRIRRSTAARRIRPGADSWLPRDLVVCRAQARRAAYGSDPGAGVMPSASYRCSTDPAKLGRPVPIEIPAPQNNTSLPSSRSFSTSIGKSGPSGVNTGIKDTPLARLILVAARPPASSPLSRRPAPRYPDLAGERVGDGIAAVAAEGAARDLHAGRGLAALVFGEVEHAPDPPHRGRVMALATISSTPQLLLDQAFQDRRRARRRAAGSPGRSDWASAPRRRLGDDALGDHAPAGPSAPAGRFSLRQRDRANTVVL